MEKKFSIGAKTQQRNERTNGDWEQEVETKEETTVWKRERYEGMKDGKKN